MMGLSDRSKRNRLEEAFSALQDVLVGEPGEHAKKTKSFLVFYGEYICYPRLRRALIPAS